MNYTLLKSRTVWTFIALFVINGIGGIHNMLPVGIVPIVDIVLAGLGMYFHVNPQQSYGNSSLM